VSFRVDLETCDYGINKEFACFVCVTAQLIILLALVIQVLQGPCFLVISQPLHHNFF